PSSCINLSMAHICGNLSSGDFYMVGIIHRDPCNTDILSAWVERLKPDVITVEISPYGLAFRQRLGLAYHEKLDAISDRLHAEISKFTSRDIEDLYSFMRIPAEYAVSQDYCSRNDALLFPVDMDYFSMMRLSRIDELIDPGNIRHNFENDERRDASSERVYAGLFFKSGITAFTYDTEMEIRDRFMSRKIAVLRKHLRDRRFVHIAGWQHLKDPLDIYQQFRPVKIFPYD
ncbi:MAG: hypothetical protein ACYDHW_05130, partial [Syntrophorhabdaceae bacterium]